MCKKPLTIPLVGIVPICVSLASHKSADLSAKPAPGLNLLSWNYQLRSFLRPSFSSALNKFYDAYNNHLIIANNLQITHLTTSAIHSRETCFD
jgi:hypothetical protein